MENDELAIGWHDYWINYKKQNHIQPRVEDYKQPIILNRTLDTTYNTSNSISPTTMSIKKEKKIIHIKL